MDHIQRLKELLSDFNTSVSCLDTQIDIGVVSVATAESAARVLAEVDKLGKAWRDATKKLTALEHRLAYEIVPRVFDDVTAVDIAGLGRVSIQSRFSCTIKDEERENAIAWLKNNGYDGLVKETINASTLKAQARMYMQETGYEFPEDFFTTKVVTFANVGQ